MHKLLVALLIGCTVPFNSLGLTYVTEKVTPDMVGTSEKEIRCLTRNVYFEARSQSTFGKLAVAQVTLNRVRHPKYPSTICKVVHQGPKIKNRPRLCQFSWTCDGVPDKVRSKSLYKECERVSMLALLYRDNDITLGATHYHATYVNPWWAKRLLMTVQIEDHIFYKVRNERDYERVSFRKHGALQQDVTKTKRATHRVRRGVSLM